MPEGSLRSTGKSREKKSRGNRQKRSSGTSVEGVTDMGLGAVSGEECEGEFGPKTPSPERGGVVYTFEFILLFSTTLCVGKLFPRVNIICSDHMW